MDNKQKKKSQRERGSAPVLKGGARACFGTGCSNSCELPVWTAVGDVRRSTRWAAVGAAVGVKGHWVLV